MRVVAVHVPHFAVVAHRRRDPVLRRRPVALVAGERAAVIVCSPDAARRGIAPGMSPAAAEAACAGAALVALDAAYCRDEHARVGTALLAVAPALEDAEDEPFGSWCFRAEGLSRLHPTEPRLAAATRGVVLGAGYAARVAIAGGRFPALVAARYGRAETACVPEGRDAEMLAPLPLDAVPLGDAARRRLRMLGATTLGDLARLPEEGVRARFGAEGAHAHRLARGLDPSPLAPRGAPALVEATAAIDPPAEALDIALFHLRALCNRVVSELDGLGRACAEAALELGVHRADPAEVAVRLARPTLSARALWTLLRLRLERIALDGPVASLRLAVVDAPPARAEQRALFRAVRDDEQLEAAVERLRARFGAGAAVSPLALEVHRPEARVVWHDFRLDGPPGATDEPRDVCVLRLVSPPEPLAAEERDGRVVCFSGTGLRCQVAQISQPHRLSGEWWGGDEFARDYYIVLASSGRLLWVFRSHDGDSWFVHGEFD